MCNTKEGEVLYLTFDCQVDTKIITKIALNETDPDTSLIKMICKDGDGTKYPCRFSRAAVGIVINMHVMLV